jgi:hypothetical protein
MALTKVSYSMIKGACVNVLDFGAVADAGVTTGTDNTAAFTAAIAAAEASGQALYIPAGKYFFNGGKLTINNQMIVCGDGIGNTVLMFGGSPTKEQITRIVWRSEYDVGDYTNNSDAAVAWGIRVLDQNVTLTNFSVITNEDPNANYPLPFNSATDYPTSNYNYGVIVQRANVMLQTITVSGVWTTAATSLDGSNVGGIGDGFNAYDCQFFGQFGFQITGAQGQPVSGDEYLELTSLDTRTAGGISDVNVIGCNIGDTSCGLRLFINTVRKGVRRSTTGGGLYINGQVFFNTAKRIQGIRFFNTRFASSDPYVYKVNYANRVEFYACHSEYRVGFYNTDGVTLITNSDCEILVTENAREVLYVGGEKSGEQDERTIVNTTDNVQIVSEMGFDNVTRQLSVQTLSRVGDWTPTLTAATPGTPTYASQFGRWTRVGDLVFLWGRIQLSSKGGITGSLSISDLPFTVANFAPAYDPSVTFGAISNVTPVTIGGLANNNAKTILLLAQASGTAITNLTDTGITDATRLDFSLSYMTTDA